MPLSPGAKLVWRRIVLFAAILASLVGFRSFLSDYPVEQLWGAVLMSLGLTYFLARFYPPKST